MATKIKKGYGVTKKTVNNPQKSQSGKNEEIGERRERPIHAHDDVIAAPLWRRIAAYVFDVVLSLFSLTVMLYSTTVEGTLGVTQVWILLGAFVMQLWLFGFLPGDYTPGQTLGKKLFRLYVRQVANKRPLGIWRNFLRDFVYGVIGLLFSIPFEAISLVVQFLLEKPNPEKKLQNLPLTDKPLTLPRDLLFKVEVIYVPKAK